VLCLVNDGSEAAEAMARGASGVLLRGSTPRRLHDAIRAIVEGMMVVDEEFAERILRQPRARVDLFEPLTARELQVAQLLAGGLTNKEIAQRLGVTEHTVKFHLNGILRKLGVSTRTEAVVQAARLGLLIL
jgi:two-component system nitrate/nitrite response regulator NarL